MVARSRFVGAVLIAEAILVVVARVLTFVYVIAREAYAPDEAKVPLPRFLPWFLISAAVVTVLLWAGTRFRSWPEEPWAAAGAGARAALILAFALNAAACMRGVVGFVASFDRGAEVLLAWALSGLVCGAVAILMLRSARARRPV